MTNSSFNRAWLKISLSTLNQQFKYHKKENTVCIFIVWLISIQQLFADNTYYGLHKNFDSNRILSLYVKLIKSIVLSVQMDDVICGCDHTAFCTVTTAFITKSVFILTRASYVNAMFWHLFGFNWFVIKRQQQCMRQI